MKTTSEPKQIKSSKKRGASPRRSVSLTPRDEEFIVQAARRENVTASEVLRTLVAKGRRADEAADRIGQVQADLRALKSGWDNLTVTLEMIGGNGASALIPLKTIFGRIHPDGDGARRASPADVGDAYRELSRNAAQIFTNLMKDSKKKLG